MLLGWFWWVFRVLRVVFVDSGVFFSVCCSILFFLGCSANDHVFFCLFSPFRCGGA